MQIVILLCYNLYLQNAESIYYSKRIGSFVFYTFISYS